MPCNFQKASSRVDSRTSSAFFKSLDRCATAECPRNAIVAIRFRAATLGVQPGALVDRTQNAGAGIDKSGPACRVIQFNALGVFA